jgi:prevent-host-death family protein
MQIALNLFKAKLSEYINQMLTTGKPIFITRHGKTIAKVLPSNEQEAWNTIKKEMMGSVLKYDDPTEPVGLEDWEEIP